MVERVYPDGTSSGTHGYNAAGWLDRLGLAITATRYDARGQAVGVHGTGTRTVSTYDAARGWLVNRSTTMGAAQLQSLTYSRGPTGRIEAVTGASAAESWSYSYDTLDRIWSGPTTKVAIRSTRPMPTTSPATWCRTAG